MKEIRKYMMLPVDSISDQMKMRKSSVLFKPGVHSKWNMNVWGVICKARRWFFNTANELPLGCIADKNRLPIYVHFSTLHKTRFINVQHQHRKNPFLQVLSLSE